MIAKEERVRVKVDNIMVLRRPLGQILEELWVFRGGLLRKGHRAREGAA